jgi:hypothetical protein
MTDRWLTFIDGNEARITIRIDDILVVEESGLGSRIIYRGPLGNIIFDDVGVSEARRISIVLRSPRPDGGEDCADDDVALANAGMADYARMLKDADEGKL